MFLNSVSKFEDEQWHKIDGFNYWISNYGQLVHWSKRNNFCLRKQTNIKGGYFSVILEDGEKHKSTRIHRLVAEYFVPNPQNKEYVNHIDGNKQNNNYKNLEWCSAKENFEHAKNNGLWEYNRPYKCRPVFQYSLNDEFIKEYDSAMDAYRQTGICARDIISVARKEEYNKEKHLIRKQAGGYKWTCDKINIGQGGDA